MIHLQLSRTVDAWIARRQREAGGSDQPGLLRGKEASGGNRTITFTTRPRAPSWSSWPSVTLAQFAALAVEDDSGELVAPLAPVELDKNAAAISRAVDEPQQVERLDQPTELLRAPAQA